MQIDFDDNVRPFFQVLVKKVDKKITAQKFLKKFKEVVSERNNNSNKHWIEIKQPTTKELTDENFFAILIKHSQVPTWFKQEGKIDLKTSRTGVLLDIENDIMVYYVCEDYVFIHSNCSQIFSLVVEAQDLLFENGGIKFKKLDGDQLSRILNQFQIEYRSLGIQNHFGLGGTAPDGKTYYGRDTSRSLTPSFDAGYGFSYCIGAMILEGGTIKPFGCSKNKSKIWTSWVDDLNALCAQCDLIVQWLKNTKKGNNQLDVLVQSTDKKIISEIEPVEFFLDYYVVERGLVFLGKEDEMTLDWDCRFDPNKKTIAFEIRKDDVVLLSEIAFKYIAQDETYVFSYVDKEKTVNIAINEEIDQITARSVSDLVMFLNKQQHFTILYDEPYAYRDQECWLDNRLKRVFLNTSDQISWRGVDIRKENLKAAKGKVNILERIDEYFSKNKNVVFSCVDNGANEISDYVVFFENRIILIHAKYAGDDTPKVSIGDIQVVASQAVKNCRFFIKTAYSEKILQRLFKNATGNRKLKTFKVFKEKLEGILESKDTIKECWIVQPGISIPKLTKDSNNKMHTILNFVDSVLRVNGIEFKLIANSK